MPIKIPDNLPARTTLMQEHVPLIAESIALRQNIRPLRVLLLNLMPDKVSTETQFARLLGSTPLQVEMILMRMDSHVSKTTAQEHMLAFYQGFEEVREEIFDGLLVTGAPVEHLPFEGVTYWQELTEVIDWSTTHISGSVFYVCWAAQAALYHRYRVAKHALPHKVFGLFSHHRRCFDSPLLTGFGEAEFPVPVSRYTETLACDLPSELRILAESDEAGLCLLEDIAQRSIYMFNHLEYDSDTLAREFLRDQTKGLHTALPQHYFPDNDPSRKTPNSWRPFAQLLMGNWVNALYCAMSL